MRKIKRKPRGPRATFGMLGLPCGTILEFVHEHVSLHSPLETFKVADQELTVKCEYGGKVYATYSLGDLTRKLVKKMRGPDANTNLQPIRFWICWDTNTLLKEIYDEKKKKTG